MKSQFTIIVKTLVFVILPTFIYAQQINNQLPTDIMVNNIRTQMSRFNDESNTKVKGSPYINEDFEIVKITQIRDSISQIKDSIYSGRYNAFTYEMEILSEDSKIKSLDPTFDYEVRFVSTNKLYRSISYTNSCDIEVNRFLVVLSENKNCSLFKEEHVEFFEKSEAKSSYSKEKPATYKRSDDIYFIKIGEEITILPQKKKQLLKQFPEKELKDYIKEHKLNPKKEKDLIKIIEYLSTIIE